MQNNKLNDERYVLNKKEKEQRHVIKEVYPDSIAEELEIEAGDVLLAINDQAIQDVFDYRYLIKNEYIEVLVEKQDGEEWLLEIDKDYDEDLGIEFENGLMSEYRTCSNKCIFCFIDQMPPGMRETLYFKDDDSRLSFLQGNYITLTNMKLPDIERIIQMHLAPINISVQTTNPELRCKMLHNRFAGEKLKFLDILYENHIEMNGQVVVCKNVNDGKELERTIDDLSKFLPFMRSVSAVPAGITKYREGLYPLELFTKEEAGQVIDMIESRQKKYYEEFGLHFIHASDEWYILAGEELPEEDRYDGYLQLENGVGMLRLLDAEVRQAVAERDGDDRKLSVTVATGRLAAPYIAGCMDVIREKYPNITSEVIAIKNNFFGEKITVSGLITGQDLIEQLSGRKLGDRLLIPCNMLRSGEDVFLDDITITELSEKLGKEIIVVDPGGADLVSAVLDPVEHKKQIRRQMYEQTSSCNSGKA